MEENRRLYNEYYDEYKNFKYTPKQDFENLHVNYFLLHIFEKRLYRKIELLEPPLEINMEIVVMYVSPTGRNKYKKSIGVPYKQIKEQYLKYERKINKMYI